MSRTYREIAIEQMLRTVEETMSGVIDWWGDLPAPMQEAVGQFRIQLGAAIDSVEFVKRALDRQAPETDTGRPCVTLLHRRGRPPLVQPRPTRSAAGQSGHARRNQQGRG
jgi:hypothetical protein